MAELKLNLKMMTMIDDEIEDVDQYNDYAFNDLLFELERSGEILRQFEAGEMPVNDDCSLTDDDKKK